MDRLICTDCDAEVGRDEVACPECGAVLTTEGAVRAVAAEPSPGGAAHTVTARTDAAPPASPPREPAATPPPAERTTCPHCRTSLTTADLVCMVCLRELPSVRPGAPRGEALRTTLERDATLLRLTFTTGEIVVRPGQQIILGRDPRHTATAARLAPFDNVSRTHATVGLTTDGAAWLRDENSANGTWADGEPVPAGQTRVLRDGSVIRLASDVTAGVRLPDA
ncbi:FHA domain-containing protein [Streptomyces ortus]|uniref:FHA domain-containing protein n=1 Tax=Streptomyces ortus TaxID=2867268 RepID=A0ABT3VBW1_9ACTN|nr:FHA domain-containing protein [Streptomyces ortus]MCX4237280.1 FHA domain-containing protein [Streptomyces ortus]